MTWPQYRRGECTAWGFRVKLSRLQADVLAVLLMRFPAAVPTGDLIEAAWPAAEPDYAKHLVQRTVRELSVKLGGFHFACLPGFGFRLEQGRMADAA